jgi:GntR family transcriptional regulator/MocR family aminotransferase
MVPVPSQGLHLVARFGAAVDADVAAQAKASAGVDGWLLADTCFRIRPIAGYVLGFAGHPLDRLVDAAARLAKASLTALRERR